MNAPHHKINGFAKKQPRSERRQTPRRNDRDWSKYGYLPVPIERALMGTIGRPFA
jgi:hypothetical protein